MNKLYSSFSQTKGLLWREWMDGILSGNFKPPVGAVIDLTDACNLKCGWCNAQGFRSANKLSTEHVKRIIDDLAAWGVKSVCYAGGGEPSLHEDFAQFIAYAKCKNLEVGISTNGIALTQIDIETISMCARFCGISIDSGSKETWMRIKGGSESQYAKLMENCGKLAAFARNTPLDLTYKFMLTPHNQHEILRAGKLARDLGFKSFFVRPAAFENVPGVNVDYKFNVRVIQEQLMRCLHLENETFKVYVSFRRVNAKLRKTLAFKRCLATPLMAVYCADGYAYLCIDYRERAYGLLCKHEDLRRLWGTAAHKELIAKINLDNCPRCAFAHYNEQIEAYAADAMFKWFP